MKDQIDSITTSTQGRVITLKNMNMESIQLGIAREKINLKIHEILKEKVNL